MANYGYDKNTDYTKLINQAVAMGDYRTAAIREAQRNEKVRGEGLTQYQTTSHYADYLPKTDQINSGMDRLAEQKTWSYDPANDPAWQAARKQYLREAERGTRDAMASYAGMTGGVPSTAAMTAGQQAGNYYRAQLMDRLPEYMQQDYSRWANNREMDRADLQTLAALDRQAADHSLNLQQWDWQKEGDLWQRNYTEQQAAIAAAMNRWATLGYADQSVADALGVAVGTSTQDAEYRKWQQQQSEREYADNLAYRQWQQKQSERGDAYDRAMTWIKMGIMPNDAVLAAAGIDKAMAQRYVNQAQAAIVTRSAGSSDGYSSRSRTTEKPKKGEEEPKKDKYLSNSEYQNLVQQIRQADSYEAAYAILNRVRDRVSEEQGKEIGRLLTRLFPNNPARIPLLN